MKCPYRIIIKFDYEKIKGTTGTASDYLEKGQYQEYADCYEDECPFYNWEGKCERAGGE